jgi:hypothetical protein
MRRLLLLTATILSMAGCGGNSPTAPSTPQPTTLNYSPMVQGLGYALQDVTVFQSPVQVTATLRWSNSGKDLDLYWTNALCVIANGNFAGTGCQVINRSVSPAGTSETVSGPASAGSTVRLFIINYSASPEPTTLAVTIQP